ncbi:MAG: hypothetical protein K2Q01_08540, partial [Rickettsiales bacterium]|nr:hypothetical protein [Rickettsiales bacterium]
FAVLACGVYALDKLVRLMLRAKNKPLKTVAIGLATMLLVLYPEMALVPATTMEPIVVHKRNFNSELIEEAPAEVK